MSHCPGKSIHATVLLHIYPGGWIRSKTRRFTRYFSYESDLHGILVIRANLRAILHGIFSDKGDLHGFLVLKAIYAVYFSAKCLDDA